MEQLLTGGIALLLTMVGCRWLIPLLQTKQWVEPLGDSRKKIAAIGGIALAFGTVIAIGLGVTLAMLLAGGVDPYLFSKIAAGSGFALGLGLLGFVDDYLRVIKKRQGIGRLQWFLMEVLVVFAYLFTLQTTGVFSTMLAVPFWGTVDFGLIGVGLLAVLMLATLHSVRLFSQPTVPLTVNFFAGLGLCFITARYLAPLQGILPAAVAGGAVALLTVCLPPIRLLPGKSGMLLLTGMVIAMAFVADIPLFLIPLLLVYWIVGGSTLLQYLARELQGKRLGFVVPFIKGEIKSVAASAGITLLMAVLCIVAAGQIFS